MGLYPPISNAGATLAEHSGSYRVGGAHRKGRVLPASEDSIRVGEVEVRPHEHAALVRGQEVPLTSREFDIVMMLAEHPGWVFSASQLAGESEEGDYSPESVSVLVSRLRQKFATAGASDVVETVRGFGYRLHSSESQDDSPQLHAGANRELRDAAWQLQEAVIEVEHAGNAGQQRAVSVLLEKARRDVFASLSE